MNCFVFLLLLFIGDAAARTFESTGVVPFLSLSKSLSEKFDLSFYHSDSFSLQNHSFKGKQYPSRDIQAYFQTGLNYRLLPFVSVTVGHIYQRNNPLDVDFVNEHRSFEQVTFAVKSDATSFTHRLRFEQRFIDERAAHEFKTRFRYQVGASFPLEGLQLDTGEWYFNCYNEFYFSTSGERNSFFSDDWMYAGVGYLTDGWGKIEAGPLGQFSTLNRDKDIRAFYSLQLGWIYKF